MDAPAESYGTWSSQKALLDLEHSKVPPVELLDEVGQILGVKYSHIQSMFFGQEPNNEIAHHELTFSPKEEWILRWLLKRIGLSSFEGKIRVSREDRLRMKVDNRSWLLFVYLVYHVPHQALARIFIEGDFVSNLDTCLRNRQHDFRVLPAESSVQESTISTPYLKNKKRKRGENDTATVPQNDNPPPEADSLPLFFIASICAAIKHCVDLCNLKSKDISSEHINVALTAPLEVAASVTGRLTSSFVAVLSQESSAPLGHHSLMEYATGIFGLWEHRMEEDASRPSEESNRQFTAQCLASWLTFLKWLKTSGLPPGHGHIVKKIERLIALHSVIPARTEFLSTHSVSNQPAASRAKDTPILDLFSDISSGLSPLLYDIAVRSIPRSTVRRRQSEQSWLENLFSKLAASCADDDLQELLEVALIRKVVISQNEISQIALRQFSNTRIRWPLLIRILQIDAGVFLSTSSPLMERLCEIIANAGNEDYNMIRDLFIIPLMRHAAQTRQLLNFVQFWHSMLLDDIQEDDDGTESRGGRVWQDPGVLAAFTRITRVNATPEFVRNLLEKSLEHSKGFDSGGSAVFVALAWTAIASCVIISRAKDSVTESGLLRQLLRAAVTVLTHSQCPESQRWRVWRLVRRILTVLPDEKEPIGILTPEAGGLLAYKSLQSWQDIDDYSEMIESFHLLVYRSLTLPDRHKELIQKELNYLARILNALCGPSRRTSKFGLADACLGIILQNSEVLLLTPSETLWPALWQYAKTSESTTHQRIFKELVSTHTVTSNQTLLSQCFQAIQDSILDGESHHSHFVYQILVAMPCQNIKRSQERSRLVKLLEDAGVAQTGDGMGPVQISESNNGNPLFHEFKSRGLSSNITTDPAGHLSVFEAQSFERFCLELDYAKLILQTPNQYVVDGLLSTLTILTSRNAPKFEIMPKNGPSAIYQRLCSLASVMITRFRTRLGGRYHLLLPVLQGLLRCLFRPLPIPMTLKQPQIYNHQPPWLTTLEADLLTPKSATQYTRLLTSLCDPTATSVKYSGRASARLTDGTKKAKSISGQYMQYLVMEYARCQLHGQLLPEVKAALMPGLYAVLDVMSRDLMRAMNAAMDSSSRAIFKGLYEDYQRFGRWNQS